jgi:hypothetical protein
MKTIISSRWSLFGHILRSPIDSPARKAMIAYFREEDFYLAPTIWPIGSKFFSKYPQKSPFTLATLLDQDLYRFNKSSLKSSVDLTSITTLAQDRTQWTMFTSSLANANFDLFQQRWTSIKPNIISTPPSPSEYHIIRYFLLILFFLFLLFIIILLIEIFIHINTYY